MTCNATVDWTGLVAGIVCLVAAMMALDSFADPPEDYGRLSQTVL